MPPRVGATIGRVSSAPIRPSMAPATTIAKRQLSATMRSVDAEPVNQPKRVRTSPPPGTANSTANGAETSGDAVNVVVRIRGRNDKEIAGRVSEIVENTNQQIQVTYPGHLSASVGTATASTSTGPGTREQSETTRTYAFDRVLGREADQSVVYETVVAPMLEYTLAGYNCTLVAYGNTGAGKTYTMTGDIAPSATLSGSYSVHAGATPRLLHALFRYLNTPGNATDFGVSVSYCEIYNEEIRDLLTLSPKPPGGLKLHEDPKTRSMVVHGLEEVPVTDAISACQILERGAKQRQTAQTQLNEESSRSHSILTITTHIAQSEGAIQSFRHSKFSLVDLAGSENIENSQVEGQHAKEAGKINQSLLAFAKVINSLVDKKITHIPYRDSQLTRLLKDSLGGASRTTIIANIAPTATNWKGTVATLDYSSKAKRINNKAQANARVNKDGLLKDCMAQLERLRADLVVARGKEGHYITTELWESMQQDRAELERQQNKFESELRHHQEEAEIRANLLLEQKERVTYLQGDLDAALEKIERLTTIDQHNRGLMSDYRVAFGANAQDMKADIEAIEGGHAALATSIRRLMSQASKDLDATAKLKADSSQALKTIRSQVQQSQAADQAILDAHLTFAKNTDTFLSQSEQNLQEGFANLVAHCRSLVEQAQANVSIACQTALDTTQSRHQRSKEMEQARRKKLRLLLEEFEREVDQELDSDVGVKMGLLRNIQSSSADATPAIFEGAQEKGREALARCLADLPALQQYCTEILGQSELHAESQSKRAEADEHIRMLYRQLKDGLAQFEEAYGGQMKQVDQALKAQQSTASTSTSSLSAAINALDVAMQTQLEAGVKEDQATLKTPKKRDWNAWRPPLSNISNVNGS